MEVPQPHLAGLDDDALVAVLCGLPGPPPAQARALTAVAAASRRLHALALRAAALLVHEHLCAARRERDGLEVAYAARLAEQPAEVRALLPASLALDLDGPVAAAGAPLIALSCALPKLPLQWTALRNSITSLFERRGSPEEWPGSRSNAAVRRYQKMQYHLDKQQNDEKHTDLTGRERLMTQSFKVWCSEIVWGC